MPEFTYTARTMAGDDVSGTIAASSKRESLAALAEQSLFPLRVESVASGTSRWRPKRRPSAGVIASTLTQLADLLKNGVPLLAALDILSEQATHPTLSEALTDVRDQVAEGESLDSAMAAHPRIFDELTVSVVRAGSEGAFLEESLERTANFLEVQQELKSRVTGAMIYPVFLAGAGFLITTILVVFFVPKFANLFDQIERQGGGLPFMTVALLAISDFLGSRWGLVLAGSVVGAVLWLRGLIATPKGRMFFDRWKLKIPVAGPIFLWSAVSRFCRILGTLLRNGVPLLRALEISSESAGNRVLAKAIRDSAENISAGETLAKPLAECGLFPKTVMAMIAVAEESNTLDSVLVNVADTVDRKISRQLDIMIRMAEPAMLLIMGTVILCIMVALLLPVFQMSSGGA